jgi:hypothetical protein
VRHAQTVLHELGEADERVERHRLVGPQDMSEPAGLNRGLDLAVRAKGLF